MTDSFIDLDTSKMPDLSWRIARIPKKSGGLRTLHIPNDELKSVQRQVLNYLYQFDSLRPRMTVVGFVPGRDTMSGLVQHDIRAAFVICMDVKDFFDNCNIEHARRELLLAGVPATKVDYIMQVCTYNGSFAQGAPSSPYLANIAMARFDAYMQTFARNRNLTYTRYADDIALAENPAAVRRPYGSQFYHMVGKHVVRNQGVVYRTIRGVEKLLKLCSGDKLYINSRKTRVAWRVGGQASRRITGVVMRNDALGYNAPRKMRKIARAMCHNLYMKMQDKANKVRFKDFMTDWRQLKGYVTYCDRIRKHSNCTDCATEDPFISTEKYMKLKKIFEKKGARNDSSNS